MNSLSKRSDLYIRSLFYCLLLVFIIAKIPHLYHTFFWDESWVYAPAVSYMYDHGPSLMPNAIPVDFARGHPVLFHAVCASWMHIFGKGNVSMHSFALAVSVALVICTFETTRRVFNTRVAFMAGILLMLNVYFYVASSMVLTDVMLTLFAFLSLYFYAIERYAVATIMLTLLYYTKESGMVMAFVVFVDIVMDALSKKTTFRQLRSKALVFIVPLLLIALFFIVQKQVYGWYLYPSHTGIIHMGIEYTFGFIQKSMAVIFNTDYVYLNYLLLIILLVALYIRTRRKMYAYTVLTMVFVYMHITVFGHKDAIFYAFIILFIVALVWFLKTKLPIKTAQERFIKLTLVFCAGYVYFSCINFFENRYLLPVVFLISIVLLAALFHHVISRLSIKLFWPVVVLLTVTGLCSLHKDNREMSAYKHLEVQQWMVTYMEDHNYHNKNIAAFSFLARVHLNDPKTGFLKSEKYFQHISDNVDSSTQIVICDNIEPSDRYEAVKNDPSFRLLQRHQNDGIWTEIYERK